MLQNFLKKISNNSCTFNSLFIMLLATPKVKLISFTYMSGDKLQVVNSITDIWLFLDKTKVHKSIR